ncbi:hypothetical protein QFZ81_003045 [Paenibacillus sp. V4I9]|uniref:hypothetical protein n=1 Tax=Paenibacillus sp. V4I9 TaxID=3042308 RepID=UPI0027885F88|nr:hypothetical protein [Paenibacillus sp. V4I9]MDQ0887957.1 hypothetical protein [Paenibacillus sp. V4I9]
MQNSNEFFEDLEIYRNPAQMRVYFEMKRTEIIDNKEYVKLARLKKGRYKEFLEEFYPLYLFSQTKYVSSDSEIRLVVGNQRYDGLLKLPSGHIQKIEITEYIDGHKENMDAKKINERGYSEMRIGDTRDLKTKANDYMEKVIENANRKAQKDYQGTSIIILINSLLHLDIWELKTDEFIVRLLSRLRELQFNSDAVYLLVRNSDPVEDINNNIYKVI